MTHHAVRFREGGRTSGHVVQDKQRHGRQDKITWGLEKQTSQKYPHSQKEGRTWGVLDHGGRPPTQAKHKGLLCEWVGSLKRHHIWEFSNHFLSAFTKKILDIQYIINKSRVVPSICSYLPTHIHNAVPDIPLWIPREHNLKIIKVQSFPLPLSKTEGEKWSQRAEITSKKQWWVSACLITFFSYLSSATPTPTTPSPYPWHYLPPSTNNSQW